jgi:hypothetical protein
MDATEPAGRGCMLFGVGEGGVVRGVVVRGAAPQEGYLVTMRGGAGAQVPMQHRNTHVQRSFQPIRVARRAWEANIMGSVGFQGKVESGVAAFVLSRVGVTHTVGCTAS